MAFKPKGELGVAIMLGGKKPKGREPEEDTEEYSAPEESEDSGSDKYTALYEEIRDCEAEDDMEGAAKALKTFIKLCMKS